MSDDDKTPFDKTRFDKTRFDETPFDEAVEQAFALLQTMPDWVFQPTYIKMGAVSKFDYANDSEVFSERLTRCYELAANAFDWKSERDGSIAEPLVLVHGSWQAPDNDDAPRINHAWVGLDNGMIWEPISALVYNLGRFMEATRAEAHYLYSQSEAGRQMMRSGHYGPWS